MSPGHRGSGRVSMVFSRPETADERTLPELVASTLIDVCDALAAVDEVRAELRDAAVAINQAEFRAQHVHDTLSDRGDVLRAQLLTYRVRDELV